MLLRGVRHLYALLEIFHSVDSGECNPSDAKLGKAAGGKCGRTAGTQTRSLAEKGHLTKTPSRGASNYTFPGIREPEGRQHRSDLNGGRSATSRNKVGKVTSEGRQQGCRAEPILEPILEPTCGAEAPRDDVKTHLGKKKGTSNRDFVRVADGWLIRHGCDQYKAWRQHASQISDGNLYYRFKDEPGHVALAPSLWPSKPKGPPK